MLLKNLKSKDGKFVYNEKICLSMNYVKTIIVFISDILLFGIF